MSSDRNKVLLSAIRAVIKPSLASIGFEFDAGSRTFRKHFGGCLQIINFQAGVRAMAGRLTVNLAIFHPLYRQDAVASPVPERPKEYDCLLRTRLSTLRDTPITKFFRSRITNASGLVSWWLVTPTDYWWRLSDNEIKLHTELKRIELLLLNQGLEWLASHCDEAILKEAHENITRRKS